ARIRNTSSVKAEDSCWLLAAGCWRNKRGLPEFAARSWKQPGWDSRRGLVLMARIAGVDLPRNKHTKIALTYIYGIGHPRAARILTTANVNPDKKVQDLTEEEVNHIRQVIESE